MANVLSLNGFFGVKQAFNVADPVVTTGWTEGQLFNIASIGTPGGGTLKGAVGARGPFVGLVTTSGSTITGIALEGSDEATSPVSGMQQPSGSMVTLLHGHSSFTIQYKGTGATALARWADGAPWQAHVESANLMDLLYTGEDGKFSTGTLTSDLVAGALQPHAIGYLSQVPSAGNDYTMGVVLFG